VLSSARTLQTLLDLSPGRPLVVRKDGSIEADLRLLREIGLEGAPAELTGLAGTEAGLVAEDVKELETRVRQAVAVGGRFECQVRVVGSGRVLDVRGSPAPSPEPPGTMLLWLFDTSYAEAERAKLAQRLDQTEGALDALTRLIEAAPFPMWYRGPDLNLGLVNSAFVDAVEGRDAADVIARSTELLGDTAEAKANYLKASQLNPTDAYNFIMLAAMLNDEYQNEGKQYQSMTAGTARDEQLKKVQALLDSVIDAYAHAVALSEGNATLQQIRQQYAQDLESYYKYRHKGSTEGMQQLIDKYKAPAKP